MHVRKAHDELLKLLDSAPANLDTLTKAAMLLDGMEASNMDADEGERPNETVNEKLHSARAWFEILCGVGEDGNLAGSRPSPLHSVRSHRGERQHRARRSAFPVLA